MATKTKKRSSQTKSTKAQNTSAKGPRSPGRAKRPAGATAQAPAARSPTTSTSSDEREPALVADRAAPKQRWRDLSVHELRSLYEAKVGRSTGSTDRGYLILKIRAAEKGLCPTGPRAPRRSGPTTAVTILFGDDVLAELDTTAKADGFRKRLPYLRVLFSEALAARGHAALAGRLAG